MSSFNYYNKTVAVVGGMMFINGSFITEVSSEEEAREIAHCLRESELLSEEVGSSTKRELTESEIIVALKENETFRVTEQTVSLFKEAVEEKVFIPSNALLALRESRSDAIGGKIDFKLSDGSVVWVDSETVSQLNTKIDMHESTDLVTFMCKNPTNFIKVVEELLED
jgi:hypothetical protein